MNRYRVMGTIGMVLMIVFLIVGCGTKESVTTDEYNDYQPLFSEGRVVTPEGLYQISDNILHQYTENGENSTLSSVDAEKLFYYKDELSYLVVDASKMETSIYSLDDKGEAQEKTLTVNLPDSFKEEMQKEDAKYTDVSKIVGNIYVQGFWEMARSDGNMCKAYVTDLDDPSNTEEISIASLGERTAHVIKIGQDWIIIASIDLDNYSANLTGYNMKTKELKKIVERTNFTYKQDWISDLQIKGDELYWYEYGTGFCKKNIEKQTDQDESTVVLPASEWIGHGLFSSDYLIKFDLAFPDNPIPEDKVGISFYSYDGSLVQFIATPNESYQYCMETEDKIYLTNQDEIFSSGMLPTAYIDKTGIANGKVKIVQIIQN